MRVYKQCQFLLGTKIPFSEGPGLVERFLEEQGLHYRHFLYQFKNLDISDYYRSITSGENCRRCDSPRDCGECRREAEKYLKKKTACQRVLEDCPALGPLLVLEEKGFVLQTLTNLASPSKDARDLVIPLMPKIHRKYGFSETYLCYHGVEFFSRSWPEADPSRKGLEGIDGAYIMLMRGSLSSQWNGITMQVEINDHGEILDAAPYLDAMEALLPGARRREFVNVRLTPQEQAEIDEIQKRAEPAVMEAAAFFASHFPEDPPGQDSFGPVSLAPTLKRMCREYSYRYLGFFYRVYRMEKQTPSGHFLTLEFETGRMGDECNVIISLEGPGFSQRIADVCHLPESQEDAVSHLRKLFSVLNEAEKRYITRLDKLFPPIPEWYPSVRPR